MSFLPLENLFIRKTPYMFWASGPNSAPSDAPSDMRSSHTRRRNQIEPKQTGLGGPSGPSFRGSFTIGRSAEKLRGAIKCPQLLPESLWTRGEGSPPTARIALWEAPLRLVVQQTWKLNRTRRKTEDYLLAHFLAEILSGCRGQVT